MIKKLQKFPDTLESGRIKFRLKFCPKLLQGFYWKVFLKEEAFKNLEIAKN